MTLPPSDFAATFRAIVIPRLRPVIDARALFVALGMEDFSEAFAGVMSAALKQGAAHLPAEHLHALEDWAASALLAAIDAKDQPRSDAVWRDVSDWNRQVLEHFASLEVADA